MQYRVASNRRQTVVLRLLREPRSSSGAGPPFLMLAKAAAQGRLARPSCAAHAKTPTLCAALSTYLLAVLRMVLTHTSSTALQEM